MTLSQSLSTASAFRNSYRSKSLHSYFLLAGDSSVPIVYAVSRVRDGKSYCTRLVNARQRGKNIFTCAVSFQVPEYSTLEHQYPMPAAPDPESLPSAQDLLSALSTHPDVPAKFKKYIALRQNEPIPVDMRSTKPTTPEDYLKAPKREPHQMLWMKANGSLGDDLALHQTVVAYCSDHQLLNTTLLPHGVTWFTDPQLQMIVSLDHSMYFHAPFRADDWLLYEMESPRSGSGRGLSFGRIYTRDGTHVVTVTQEGLIRAGPRPKKNKL